VENEADLPLTATSEAWQKKHCPPQAEPRHPSNALDAMAWHHAIIKNSTFGETAQTKTTMQHD
jgi:hypothetical protein